MDPHPTPDLPSEDEEVLQPGVAAQGLVQPNEVALGPVAHGFRHLETHNEPKYLVMDEPILRHNYDNHSFVKMHFQDPVS
jgi:hypothetical protein